MPDGAPPPWPAFGFPPRLMRPATAAYYLGMSESSFRDRVVPALPPPLREGGMVLYRREDLDAWIDRRAGVEAASAADTWADL